MRKFQNYHCHKDYTNVRISDSIATLSQYADRANSLGHGVLSSMEHGWQGYYFQTILKAKERNLKPLIGAEAYWVRDRFEKDRTNCHIYVGAKNETGRQALNDILSEANITGFYGQPRIDIPLILSLPKNDVIVTSACLAYWKYEDIENITKEFAKHFKDNFFLEVQYHNTESQRMLNKRILEIHNTLQIPLIMGCDSHFVNQDQRQTRTDFLLSKGLSYPEEEGWFLDYPDGDTAYQRFAEQCVLEHSEITDAMDNTNIFLDIEEYNSPVFDTNIKMPSIHPLWSQKERNDEYRRLVYKGWNDYKETVPEDKIKHYEDEIGKEIQTVIDTGMSDYFINNYHIIQKGKENGGWLTKSGRGSAVSFITNMLLGFTEVDRIASKIHMYPERFMSKTRILQSGSLPDIDFNCAPVEPFAKAQQEIMGEDHSYPMIAYGTMQKSAAWKLYAKSQGISFGIANAVSEQIKKYENAVKHVGEEDKDEVNIADFIDEEFYEIYEKSKDYLGLVTSWSIAPCSYLLYQGSIRKDIGLVRIKDNLCCLMDGHWAEACNFLKNDLLKVSVVDLIYRSYHRIGMEPPPVRDLLSMCPPEDDVWSIYGKGCTIGINQCEQTGAASRVARYKPRNISELAGFVAAIRPGFKSMYKVLEERVDFSYGVKTFDDLIKTEEMPNSFLLYQEQEMAALNYAGIDMSECYTVIKNIAKKRADKVLVYKEKFIDGLSEKIILNEGKSPEEAEKITLALWQIIEDSSSYSFNASHSYCVALDSLYGAWLKAHHPLEFYEVCLSLAEERGEKDKMNALKEEAESFFNIKFPPFRFGQDNRKIKADTAEKIITNSITSIKGFGKTVGAILYAGGQKNFESFIEVLKWLDEKGIKETKIKPLILIDYFQRYGNANELSLLLEAWELFKQGAAKLIKKDKAIPPILLDILQKGCPATNKNGDECVSFKIEENGLKYLFEYEKRVKADNVQDSTIKEKIRHSMDFLGYADVVTGKEEDRKVLLITDTISLKDKTGSIWGYRIGTRSLGTGKAARLTVRADLFEKRPIYMFDIVRAIDIWKNQQGYWYLLSYKKEA
jgi:DNA polymerase III alpha subunit